MITVTISGPQAAGKTILVQEIGDLLRLLFHSRIESEERRFLADRSAVVQRRKAARKNKLFAEVRIVEVQGE